jgi:hypothetical protein
MSAYPLASGEVSVTTSNNDLYNHDDIHEKFVSSVNQENVTSEASEKHSPFK